MLYACLILLLNVLGSYGQTCTCTCITAYLDEPCPTQRCLPNAVNLAAGFDASDSTFKGLVLGLQYGDSVYTNPSNGLEYTIPNGVTVLPLADSTELTGTFIMHNTSESERWQSESMVGKQDYILGMSSHTTDTYYSISSQYQKMSQVGYVLYNYAFYEVLTPPSAQELGPLCYQNVMDLPVEYDQAKYIEFIKAFGTHFLNTSKWGLKYKFASSYKTCIMSTHTESYVYTQTQTDGWLHSDEHTTYSGYSSTDSYYSSRRVTSESFSGGNIMYHSSSRWDDWVWSGANMENPIPVAFSIVPIYTLINDTIRKENMVRAYREYFAMRKKQQDKIIEDNKMGPRDVTLAHFKATPVQTTNGKGVWRVDYLNGPSKIQLSANSSSSLVGVDGPCAHVSQSQFYDISKGLNSYAYIALFQCSRDMMGNIVAKHYFSQQDWINSVKPRKDNCGPISINMTDPVQRITTNYSWSCDSTSCRGVQNTKQWNPTTSDMRVGYISAYRDGTNQFGFPVYHVIKSYDGLSRYPASLTNFDASSHEGGGYFTCYLDCSGGLYIPLDEYGHPTNVQCTC